MKKQSAGILLYEKTAQGVRVFLVHHGGPFWAKKDTGAWSIPKGEFDDTEEPPAAAKREFNEEVGMPVPEGTLLPLGTVKQSSGKVVHAWAVAGMVDPKKIQSNTFSMEWPPKSGAMQEFPEVDKAAWFTIGEASKKIVKGQLPLLDALTQQLGIAPDEMTAQPSKPQQTQLL